MIVYSATGEPGERRWRWWLALEAVVWVLVGVMLVADELLILATLADFWGSRVLPN